MATWEAESHAVAWMARAVGAANIGALVTVLHRTRAATEPPTG